MKIVYNLIFIITLVLIGGLITNVDASAQLTLQTGGQIIVTRKVKGVHNPVSNTFTYSIKADSNNPAVVTGLPSSMNIVFNRVQPSTNYYQSDYDIATQTGILDLTGVTFPKVGDYLFTLRETESSNDNSYPVEESFYTIKVSVRYETDSNNVPTSAMTAVVANIKDKNNSKVDDVMFINWFISSVILIDTQVQGNMADTEEYFKILLNIDCLAGDTYDIRYNSENTPEAAPSITYNGGTIDRMTNHPYTYSDETIDEYYGTYTCGTDNYVYLKHGERVVVDRLLDGQEYSFTEQGAALYKTYINDSEDNNKSSGTLKVGNNSCYITPHGSGGGSQEPGGGGIGRSNIIGKEVNPINLGEATKDTSTKSLANENGCNESIIVNEFDSIIDTGLVLKFLPYIIIVVIAGIGLTVFLVTKKKRNKLSIEE